MLGCVLPAVAGEPRVLTFEERVDAQEAIDRVYHRHQLEASPSFGAVYPRSLLERKVRDYLRKSAALDAFWHAPITAAHLDRELERVASRTRFPDRLREIYAALGDDPFLIRECFARPILVDRLARNFFAGDQRIHEAARAEAEAVRLALAAGGEVPGVTPVRSEVVRGRGAAEGHTAAGANRVRLDPDAWEQRRRLAPEETGKVGDVVETRDGFSVEVLLSEAGDRFQVETYHVPKRTWQDWWEEAAPAYDPESAKAVASAGPLPLPSPEKSTAVFTEGGGCLPLDSWNNGSLDDIPEPRFNHSTVWTGSVMIVWGGFGLAPYLRSGGKYDPLTDAWTPISTLNAPSARHLHSTVWTGSLMMIWGGDGAANEVNTGGRYDPVADTWTSMGTTNAPLARKSHGAVWTGTEMIVWGGTQGTTSTLTGGRYNPVSNTWTPTAIDLHTPNGREDMSAVWIGSRMLIWGGVSSTPLNDGAFYDPALDTWSAMNNSSAPTPRFDHTTVWTGSEMIVWGGYSHPDSLNTGGVYDPAADDWFLMTTLGAPSARRSHSAVWTGTELIVWGGVAGTIQNTGGRWNRATDSWQPTSTTNAPTPRQLHSAIWTGTEMIVWTGISGTDLTTSGGRYIPATNSWTPTSTDTSQPARKDHTAVWTGNEMIVWGGFGSGSPAYRRDGARYDPVIDQWSSVTLTGAPTGRSQHHAFWTGSRMVVWGGFDGFTAVASGGRYDPLSDTWTPINTVNSPSPRTSPGAAWTGSEMIVWGGATGGTFLDSGARYNAAGDFWTPMSTVNAPSARFLHSMIWTGTEVLVWAGDGQLGLVNTGGRYDPGTDTWSAMTAVGAPSIRTRHQVVWTGTEMIVWGGRDEDFLLTSGGRYDPGSDTWQPTSIFNAPSGRIRSAAVWSGSEMIIWGGFDETAFPYLDTGARYDPFTDTWVPTSVEDAPSPRNEHTAAWVDGLMVIWGGSDGSVLNTGGRYVTGALSDADSDGVADLCDNCPAIANAGQEDGDVDGIGDVCDNCSAIFNSGQEDFDVDGIGDLCDNCPLDFNDLQTDTDLDTFGDACDCAPTDGGAFAIPGEAINLTFQTNTLFSWDSTAPGAGSGTQHQALRGVASQLPVGSGPSEVCLGTGAVTEVNDPTIPGLKAALWYLVRGTNTCGPGTWGSDSNGTERLSALCP